LKIQPSEFLKPLNIFAASLSITTNQGRRRNVGLLQCYLLETVRCSLGKKSRN